MDNNLNKICVEVYPDWYEQEQKDEYEECMALGRAHVGAKITKTDEYLIQISAKMAINLKYNKGANLTQEELNEIKAIHQETLKTRVFETPPDGWYSTEKNPLNCPYVPEILPNNPEKAEETEVTEVTEENVIVNKDIV
jgi:hypothetical protein